MKQKGQITIFILLGLLVLLFIIFFISLNAYVGIDERRSKQKIILELDQTAQSMNALVESCIKTIGEETLITIGYNGGHAGLIEPYFDGVIFTSNYIYYLGEKDAPSLDETREALEELMNEHVPKCVIGYNTENFFYQGATVNAANINTSVVISDNLVLFTVHWPLTLQIEESEKRLEDFAPISFSVRLKQIILFVEKFAHQLEINPYFIDTFYLLQQNLSFDIALFNNDTYVILISDNQSIINYEPYSFLFAAKINTTGLPK